MRLRFLEKRHEIGQVFSYDFEPKESIQWQAGQSMRFEIELKYTSDERRFTISSAPFEGKITITTKLSDSKFKQALFNLQKGDEIMAYGPDGNFLWRPSKKLKVLIASGIGITPFYSMFKQYQGQSLRSHLIYAGREDGMPFADELLELQRNHQEFNIELLKNQRFDPSIINDAWINDAQFYVSGSTQMVREINNALLERNRNIQIFKDSFTGNL